MGPNWLITIGADHASLAGVGHFPGHPVVPGVVMRREIWHVIREMAKKTIEFGHAVGEISVASQLCRTTHITLDKQDDQSLEFTCTTGSRLNANDCLCYCTAACNAGTMFLASVLRGVRYEVHLHCLPKR